MQAGWRVGSVFGIPLFVSSSWFFIVALVAISDGLSWHYDYPQWGTALTYGAGLVMALLLFGSVLLHELGHSLVALSQGIQVNSITLFLFGGIASIEEESKTPGKAFQVAIAGPVVSLTLFALLTGLNKILPGSDSPVRVVTEHLASLNLVLALFNLLPGLPLDGGQILKATVWKMTGDRLKGTHWAAATGRILGWTAIVLGIATDFLTQDFGGGLWIALLGWFGVRNANAYDRVTDVQEALLVLKADDAKTREFRVVDAHATLRQFADEYLLATTPTTFFAASEGRYRGLVDVEALQTIERSQWETESLGAIAKPLTEIVSVREQDSLAEVIQRMEKHQLRRITVLSPADAVSGVIDRGDVVRALSQKLNLQVPEAAIKLIKEEGHYPAGLKLPELAKTSLESVVEEPAPVAIASSSNPD